MCAFSTSPAASDDVGISLEKLLRHLGINPGDVAIDVPSGTTPFYGVPGQDTEGSQSFAVTNGANLDQRTSFVVGSVIVDNNTSAWISIPDATKDGTGRYVGPGLGGAFPILGHISRARVNWSAPPGKQQPAAIATEQAQVIFLASPVPPGFGFAAPIQPQRWNLLSGPGLGVQASATKAAAAGVTHIADFLAVNAFTGGSAGGGVQAVALRDGVSGTGAALIQVEAISPAATNAIDRFAYGPLLGYRGTPGNAMTLEFIAGMANTFEVVALVGYDQ